jgi:hypothetical protein
VLHIFPSSTKLITPLQAQFLISPDHTFSQCGAVTGINYSDRFKQYKRLIIKTIATPVIQALIARLNLEVLQSQQPDQATPLSPVEQQENNDEEEMFCRAFENNVALGNVVSHFSLSCV